MNKTSPILTNKIKNRFRGFLPVVVDIETSGLHPEKCALLEVCVVMVEMDDQGNLQRKESYFEHILPFDGAELDPECLAFNQIDPFQALRFALEEKPALERLFAPIQDALKKHQCQRAILVGHNAWFDLLFIKEAAKRSKLALPFHAFTSFDTATLGGLLYGQTVLAKAALAAQIPFDPKEAHSAIYDAEKTADLFCTMVNTFKNLHI
jgi:ribonuclease T